MDRNTAHTVFANLAGGTFVGLDSLTQVKRDFAAMPIPK